MLIETLPSAAKTLNRKNIQNVHLLSKIGQSDERPVTLESEVTTNQRLHTAMATAFRRADCEQNKLKDKAHPVFRGGHWYQSPCLVDLTFNTRARSACFGFQPGGRQVVAHGVSRE